MKTKSEGFYVLKKEQGWYPIGPNDYDILTRIEYLVHKPIKTGCWVYHAGPFARYETAKNNIPIMKVFIHDPNNPGKLVEA